MAITRGGIKKLEVWDQTLATDAWKTLDTEIASDSLSLPEGSTDESGLSDGQALSAGKSGDAEIILRDPDATTLSNTETMENNGTRTYFRFTRLDGSTFQVPNKGAANANGSIPHVEKVPGAPAGELAGTRVRYHVQELTNTEFTDA